MEETEKNAGIPGNDEKRQLEDLLADKKYKLGRVLIIAGIAGTVISLVLLCFLHSMNYVFVWGKTAYFFSLMPSCPFIFAVFAGGFICRKQCILHKRPKRNKALYTALTTASAILVMAVLFLDQTMLRSGINNTRSDIELREGEPIVAIETDYSAAPNNNRWIALYRDYGWYAKELAFVLGNRESITWDDTSGTYTLCYRYIAEDGTNCELSAAFVY